ncbi:MAG TPA: hypothetical protein PKA63_08225 [Oligoflexia bacterium]|nr:hypothetical protein [Oligoflexia bacterium]HMP48637.1 hypothetical protein [Oligoflexia bacterium]
MIQEIYIFLQSLNLDAVYPVDPLFLFLFDKFGGDLGADSGRFFLVAACLSFCISWVVFYFVASENTRNYESRSAFLSDARINSFLYSVFFLLGLFAIDRTGLVFFDLFPLMLMTLLSLPALRKSDFLDLIILLPFLWCVILAGPLGFFFVLLSVLVSGGHLLGARSFSNKCAVKSFQTSGILGKVSFVLLFFISFLSTYYFSLYSNKFDYPRDAQLVPFSEFTSFGSTLIGPERIPFPMYSPIFLNMKDKIMASLGIFIFPLATILIFVWIFRQVTRNNDERTDNASFARESTGTLSMYLAAVIGSMLLVSWLLPVFPETPEGLLFRLLPGLIWRPYPFLLPGIFLWYFLLGAASFLPSYVSRFGIVIGIVTASFSEVILTLKPDKLEHRLRVVMPPVEIKEIARDDIYRTPSMFLLQSYPGSYRPFDEKSLTRIGQTDEFKCVPAASKNEEDAFLALDQNYTTRWSTRGPQQIGDWFIVTCSSSVRLRRMALSIVHHRSDFPRGISLISSLNGDSRHVIDYPEWFGPVRYTPSGLPFFGPQGEVVFDFIEPVEGDTFTFVLQRGDATYDWSIAEVLMWK